MPVCQFHPVSVLNTDKKQCREDGVYLTYICRPQATNEGGQGTNTRQELEKWHPAIPYIITTDQGTDYGANEAGQWNCVCCLIDEIMLS